MAQGTDVNAYGSFGYTPMKMACGKKKKGRINIETHLFQKRLEILIL